MSSRENDPKVKESSTSESVMAFFLCTPLNATFQEVDVGEEEEDQMKTEKFGDRWFLHLEAFSVRANEGPIVNLSSSPEEPRKWCQL